MSLVQLKPRDSRYPAFVAEYGTRAYEVEALSNREIRELVIARLREEGVDFETSVRKRFKENQNYMSRVVTETILQTLKRRVRRSAMERITNYDTRVPTVDQLVAAMTDKRDFLDLPRDLIARVVQEVKDEFQITPEDDVDE